MSDTAGPKHLLEIKHATGPADFKDAGNQMNTLHEIRIKNANRLITGHLNVNSLRNKFEMLGELIKDKIDIFLISEAKLDISFPSGQFLIKGYSAPLRLDRLGNLLADHLHCIGSGIDVYSSKYDNFVVLHFLNTEVSSSFMEQFCASYNLRSLIKEPTCFKSVDNPSCIDLY